MSETSERRAAIVTGATRGIGRAIALQLATEGFNIVVNYRGEEASATSLVDELQAHGVEARAIRADITSADDVAGLIEGTI
ncbi:MAG TPA: SDR family NAD(P)-dependent oxidoreductase, partial [Thermomicrobiales bacterium]|nr:SDR family NAD(P)-dependent oxidoreductase [Thermomicrobiales bacterium]